MSECNHDCSSCSANCGERQQPESFLEKLNDRSSVKKVVAVVSGKGGVGKSLVTALTACEARRRGKRVAVLDADIPGPSIPRAFGIAEKAQSDGELLYPKVTGTGIEVMSINLLLEQDTDPVVWRGPGAGIHGGHVVYSGPANEIKYCKESITGQYLSGAKKIPLPEARRPGNGGYLEIVGAAENNLKNINVKFPLGCFVAVTGVSGSGKSSLVNEILNKALSKELMGAHVRPGKYKTLHGLELVDKVIDIDQSPIGRTPRSNPATYTGVFNDIREVFAATNEAKMRGYKIGRFSFNVKGGRCEACEGAGILEIPMHFLPDVYVPCEVCKGKRYNRETLEVKYKGKSIYDVLEMSVEEGLTFFENLPKIKRKLQTLYDVGLGYIKIGQPATTLSGGEAQRVKLATELSRRSTGKTVYILDEPTTGLHTDDVKKLIEILQKFADAGNTVIVIEHNLDVIKTADYIIDLGPEGGDGGGMIVCCGTPEEVADCKASFTGQYLGKLLKKK